MALLLPFGCATIEPESEADFCARQIETGRIERAVEAVPAGYPRRALDDGVQGGVRLALQVSRAGIVTSSAVVESEPPGVFDLAATNAVENWRFCALPEGAPDYPDPLYWTIPFRIGYR